MRMQKFLSRITVITAVLLAVSCSCLYAALPVPQFSGVALSSTSIQWNWTDESGAGIDGYHLYSTTSSDYIDFFPATASTTYYIETGLHPNQEMDRYITTYQGTSESDDSNDVDLYSYAVPGEILFVDTITASSAYMMFTWGEATAYVLECSTNNGASYVINREIFVPWQTFPVLANKNYMVRLGAVNGDGLQSPGIYSSTVTFVSLPPDPVMSAVAISSETIRWSWTSTDTFHDIGVTGYRFYISTTTTQDLIPVDGLAGAAVYDVIGATNAFVDNNYPADGTRSMGPDSAHTWWIKAVGLTESKGIKPLRKYTYAVAPSTCSVYSTDTSPRTDHVFEDGFDLQPANDGVAHEYVIDASSCANFNIIHKSLTAPSGTMFNIRSLWADTKYDCRFGAINGDHEQTPQNAMNPRAYSDTLKILTRPRPPYDFHGEAVTDTQIDWKWSTGTYTLSSTTTGYWIGHLQWIPAYSNYYVVGDVSFNSMSVNHYTMDYLITNSTHTRYIAISQYDPVYEYYGSLCSPGATGCTFATPPNDVFMDTVTSRSIGLWWKDPEVPATMYRIERSTVVSEAGPWAYVASVAGTRFVDSGLQPMTTYAYRIGAYNQLGQLTQGLAAATGNMRRDYSFLSSTETLHSGPAFYGVAFGTSSICWNWVEVVPGVLSYDILTSTNGIDIAGLTAPVTYWIEPDLNGADTQFSRRIQSQTARGWGDFADASCYTLANPPSNPAIISTGTHSISIAWNGNGSTRFSVEHSTDNATWTSIQSPSALTGLSSFNDTHLHYETTYFYQITSYNQDLVASPNPALISTTTAGMPSYATPVNPSSASTNFTTTLAGFGEIILNIPAGAAPVDGYIFANTSAGTNPTDTTTDNITEATNKLRPSILLNGSILELHYYDAFGSTVTGNFNLPLRLYLPYPDANDDGLVDNATTKMHASTLRIYNFDTSDASWKLMSNCVVSLANKQVYTDLSHFSMYALASYYAINSTVKDSMVYPNPYKPGSGTQFDRTAFGEGIVFEGLTPRTHIRIFSIAGDLVADINEDSDDGRYLWDTRNRNGDKVASGLYIYLINNADNPSDKLCGKLAIIK